MTTVYLLTTGSYSDYSVEAVFSSHQAAQDLIDEWVASESGRGSDARIEPFVLDEQVRPDPTFQRIRVVLAENGDTIEVTNRDPWSKQPLVVTSAWQWTRTPDPAKYGPRDAVQVVTFTGTTWARDFDHAIKIARDHRGRSIAANDLERLRNDPTQTWVYQIAST
jgi:hypothetical protein